MIGLHTGGISLGGAPVLHALDFTAGPGEFVALCGPNGAGKTTLLRALAGLLPGGRPQPARIAYLPQGASSAWGLTVRELVALGRIAHRDCDQAAIEAAMAACGVAHLADRRIDRMSGGQARRAMLARAFATQPEILLLDEPVADLDPAAAHDIMALLAKFASGARCVVAVLHAVDLALAHATRMVVLRDGRVVADAAPLAALPAAAAAFGLEFGMSPLPGLLAPVREGEA